MLDGSRTTVDGPQTQNRPVIAFAETVRSQAQGYAAKRKEDVARAVSHVAGAIRDSGAGLGAAPHLRAFIDNAADEVDELAEGIHRHTLPELYDEVDAAIRRRFGVALAGFALFRFLHEAGPRTIPRSHAVVPVDAFPTPVV